MKRCRAAFTVGLIWVKAVLQAETNTFGKILNCQEIEDAFISKPSRLAQFRVRVQ